MRIVGVALSLAILALILLDAFETILQPRRVTHRFRLARFFYRNTWKICRTVAIAMHPGAKREAFLSVFAPLSLLGLFATWIFGLILGFGLLHWSLATPMHGPEGETGLGAYLYLSGTTFFTLGYGDLTPLSRIGRALAVVESGLGFGFLAVIMGYLPVLFQAYSRREVTISLLDARAGSPPSAAQFLERLGRPGGVAHLDVLLAEWEIWAGELLESHLSFPVLSYFRSQHDNQSWLAALTAILDTCAILMAAVKDSGSYRAQLTFAMARHAAVDLTLVLKVTPRESGIDRLPMARRRELEQTLRASGFELQAGTDFEEKLAMLRQMYEPFVEGLAGRFLFTLPPIVPEQRAMDNWQRAPKARPAPAITPPPAPTSEPEHFQ